jgi:hypothetical protein
MIMKTTTTEQVKSGSLSFAGIMADAKIAIAAGRVTEQGGHVFLDGNKVRAPRVADAMRVALGSSF